jgi:regulatory protein
LLSKVITVLKFTGRDRNRVDVYLDGENEFTLLKNIAVQLRVGQVLSPHQIEELLHRNEEEQAYQHALRLVSRRPRSESELRDNFGRRNLSEEIQDAVFIRLREQGLVDDVAFAETWIENRMAFRPRSAWALTYELRKKGVSEKIIRTALEGFDDDEAAYRVAKNVAQKMRNLAWDDFRRRLGAHLSRRGFLYPTISPVVSRVWEEATGNVNESEGWK